jgi:hypothetical protein
MPGRLRQRFGETGARAERSVTDAAYDAVFDAQKHTRAVQDDQRVRREPEKARRPQRRS